MRAFVFICIALCVTAAAAAEVQGTSKWFQDHLESSKASIMSGYRSKVEKETLCFRTSSYCFTAPDINQPPALSKNWMEVNMECTPCPESHHDSYGPHHPGPDSDSITEQLTPILSKCLLQSQVSYPSIDLPNHQGMGIYGTYKATCVLQEDPKSGCKFPPTCEDTLVTIQGVIYSFDQAVVAGPVSSAQPLYAPTCTPEMPCDHTDVKQRCPASSRAGSTKASAMAAAMAKGQQAGRAQIPVQDGKEDTPKPVNQTKPGPNDPKPPVIKPKPGTPTVKVGGASLYKGTFTVQSTTHPLKFTRGHHQYSVFIGPPPMPKDVKLAEGLPRLGDAVHMFDFVADSQPSYY